nr:hypothetical protein [Pseudomonas sp.]
MITVPGTIKSDVLFGEDGWFFLWQGGHYQFDHLLGKRLPSPESVKNFSDNLAARRESLARRGVKYVHVVFPSKPVVMTEFLPAEYRGS